MKSKKRTPITLEDIEKACLQLDAERRPQKFPPLGETAPGSGLYHIGGGCYGGISLWNDFNNNLIEFVKNYEK